MERRYGLRKGSWTEEEDLLLKQCIEKYGAGKWRQVPPRAGLNRCSKSCRLRWLNYLRPNIKRGQFGDDEIDLIIKMHKLLGNRWSLIAGRLPGRTANDVKNYWNTRVNKKLACEKLVVNNEEIKADKRKNNTIYSETMNVIKPQTLNFSKNSNKWFEENDFDTSMENAIQQSDDTEMLMSTEKATSETEDLSIRDERMVWLERILLDREGGEEEDEEKPEQMMISSSPVSSGSSFHDEIITTSVNVKVDEAETALVEAKNADWNLLVDENIYFWNLLLPC